MTNHLILTVVAAVVVGIVLGAIIWQAFISGPEIAMVEANLTAAIEDRDITLKRAQAAEARAQDLTRERAVSNHLQSELDVRSLTPTPLYERIGEPKPIDEAALVWPGSKAGDTGWWRRPRIPDDVRDAVVLHVGAHRMTGASS